MKRIFSRWPIIPALLAAAGLAASQENWPQWRGPHQNGLVDSTSLPLTWSPTENIIWKTALPSWSAATPIIWGDRIFITSPSPAEAKPAAAPDPGQRRGGRAGRDPGGAKLLFFCLSKKDGRVLWERVLDEKNEIHNKQNNSTPSPVTDGMRVWTVTGTGKVAAFDMDGKLLWGKDLQKDYGPFGHNWGYGSSPLLFAGNLYIEVLHGMNTDDPSYVLSLDGATGSIRWRQERPTDAEGESPDAYTTPVLLQFGGQTQIVVSGGDYVTGHEIRTGKEIWRAGGLNPLKRTNYRIVPMPITVGGLIYAPTRQKPLLALKAGGTGDVTSSHLAWKYDGSGTPDVPSPVCDGRYFYLVDDRGLVTCLEAKTGALIWGPEKTTEGIVSASPILAGNTLYVLNENGVTSVCSVGAAFALIGTNALDGTYTLASPAVSGSRLFIRTSSYLYCLGKNSN